MEGAGDGARELQTVTITERGIAQMRGGKKGLEGDMLVL
jgi:hypothetical protein